MQLIHTEIIATTIIIKRMLIIMQIIFKCLLQTINTLKVVIIIQILLIKVNLIFYYLNSIIWHI